jgi:hypothetical protein
MGAKTAGTIKRAVSTNNVIRLGMCMMACYEITGKLPDAAKRFYKHSDENTLLSDIEDDDVLRAIKEMAQIVNAIKGPGFMERTLKFNQKEYKQYFAA